MCFRPAAVDVVPVTCAHCGKRINPTNGVLPKKCPFCGEALEEMPVPGAPGALGRPAAPGVPGAPGVSGTPNK